MGVLWYIIGCWRRKAGETAFAAARMADKAEERDHYCRLAVMAGHRDPAVCSASHDSTCFGGNTSQTESKGIKTAISRCQSILHI